MRAQSAPSELKQRFRAQAAPPREPEQRFRWKPAGPSEIQQRPAVPSEREQHLRAQSAPSELEQRFRAQAAPPREPEQPFRWKPAGPSEIEQRLRTQAPCASGPDRAAAAWPPPGIFVYILYILYIFVYIWIYFGISFGDVTVFFLLEICTKVSDPKPLTVFLHRLRANPQIDSNRLVSTSVSLAPSSLLFHQTNKEGNG